MVRSSQSEKQQEKILYRKGRVTISDRILKATLLRLVPSRVTPNQLTIFRYFCIPPVAALLYFQYYKLGIGLFVIAAITDALDGARARLTSQITEWGEINDPLADKLLIGSSALVILPKFLDFWLIFLIFGFEMLLIGSGYYYKNRGWHISANGWGKTKMVLQSLGVGFLILYTIFPMAGVLVAGEYALYASLFFAFVSLITYGI